MNDDNAKVDVIWSLFGWLQAYGLLLADDAATTVAIQVR
jgi:hypothetical protein